MKVVCLERDFVCRTFDFVFIAMIFMFVFCHGGVQLYAVSSIFPDWSSLDLS